jgi:hypothetical protein
MDAVLSTLLFGVGITILPFGFMYVVIRLQIHIYADKVNATDSGNKGFKSGLGLLFFKPRTFWLICKAAFSTDMQLRQAAVELLYPQYAERLQQAKAEYRVKLQNIIDAVNAYTDVGNKFQVEFLNRGFKPAGLHPDMVRASFLDETVPEKAADKIATVIKENFNGFDRTQFERVDVELPDGRSGPGSRLTALGPGVP